MKEWKTDLIWSELIVNYPKTQPCRNLQKWLLLAPIPPHNHYLANYRRLFTVQSHPQHSPSGSFKLMRLPLKTQKLEEARCILILTGFHRLLLRSKQTHNSLRSPRTTAVVFPWANSSRVNEFRWGKYFSTDSQTYAWSWIKASMGVHRLQSSIQQQWPDVILELTLKHTLPN